MADNRLSNRAVLPTLEENYCLTSMSIVGLIIVVVKLGSLAYRIGVDNHVKSIRASMLIY